jgi:hypothetical protein
MLGVSTRRLFTGILLSSPVGDNVRQGSVRLFDIGRLRPHGRRVRRACHVEGGWGE